MSVSVSAGPRPLLAVPCCRANVFAGVSSAPARAPSVGPARRSRCVVCGARVSPRNHDRLLSHRPSPPPPLQLNTTVRRRDGFSANRARARACACLWRWLWCRRRRRAAPESRVPPLKRGRSTPALLMLLLFMHTTRTGGGRAVDGENGSVVAAAAAANDRCALAGTAERLGAIVSVYF